MPRAENTLEGGSNTTTITTGNSGGGSGNAFNEIFIGSGGALTYSTDQPAHGSLGAKLILSSTPGVYMGYTTALGSLSEVWGRAYFRLNGANPASAIPVVKAYRSGGHCGFVQILTTGRVELRNGAGSLLGTLTNDGTSGGTQISVNTSAQFRLEWHYIFNATTGTLEAWLFNDAESTTPSAFRSFSGVNTGGTSDLAKRVGIIDTSATETLYVDDIVWDTAGAIGPVATLAYARPVADRVAGNWTPSTGSDLFAMIDETTASDTDYIQSSESPATADECKVELPPITDRQAGTPLNIRYEYLKSATGGDQINLTVKLYRNNGTTQEASETKTNIDAKTIGTLNVSAAAADAIPSGDYSSGLVLGFSAVKV